QLADLLLGERGAHDPDGVADAGLVQGQYVGVALDEDHPARLGGGGPGQVDAEQDLALVVELAVGGVQVLGAALIFTHPPRAETVHAAAGVDGGEHDALAEAVIDAARALTRALSKPDRDQLLVGVPRPPGGEENAVPGA